MTSGAALGLAPLAAGWGGAVTSALGAVGAPTTGVLGSALTTAVTQAGFGAAIGGAVSAVTGQDIGQGMALGAAGGALTGGITGAIGGAAPAAQAATLSARNMPASLGPLNPATTIDAAGPLARPASMGMAAAAPATASVPNAAGVGMAAAAPTAPAGGGFLGGILNSQTAGTLLAGAGKGLLAGMAAGEDADAAKSMQRQVSNSYDIDPAAYDVVSEPAQPTAAARRPRYQYDPKVRRVVLG